MSAFSHVGLMKPLSQHVGHELVIPSGWWAAAVGTKAESKGE